MKDLIYYLIHRKEINALYDYSIKNGYPGGAGWQDKLFVWKHQ